MAARAVCYYHGQFSAKTTLEQEFKDSTWVVRAKVLSATDHWSDDEASWTLYDLEIERSYKGKPAPKLKFFTLRDSGGFYMDQKGEGPPNEHDIGGEYLLFLNPQSPNPDFPKEAAGTVFVNYSCGKSGPWNQVTKQSREALTELEHAH